MREYGESKLKGPPKMVWWGKRREPLEIEFGKGAESGKGN